MTSHRQVLIFARRGLLAGMLTSFGGLPLRSQALIGDASGSILKFIPPAEHSAIVAGTSSFDCGPAIHRAAEVTGAVFLPPGRYMVATPIVFQPPFIGRFAPGPVIIGSGVGRTVIEDRTRGRALFDIDSDATEDVGFRSISGVHLEGFSIEASPLGRASAVIRLRGCSQSVLRDIHILGRGGSGIEIACLLGDLDGSNMIELDRIRIENCARWGIDAAAAQGHNEISFLTLRHVFIQNCGSPSDSPLPSSGGMRYKGQVLDIEQCAFTLNHNVGFYIPGEAGLALNARLSSTTFENNIGKHLLCTGITLFRGVNLQFFSNDAYRARTACEFSGASYTVRGVAIDGATVRATAANSPYEAFRFDGTNLIAASCEVRRVIWDNFGYPGQVRFTGLPVASSD